MKVRELIDKLKCYYENLDVDVYVPENGVRYAPKPNEVALTEWSDANGGTAKITVTIGCAHNQTV